MRALLLALALGLLAGAAHAQELRVQTSDPPYFVGEPVDLQLVASGFAREPQPEVSVESAASGTLELLGMSPNVRSSITVVDGRVTRLETVQFVFRYRFVARAAGAHALGPFRVKQGQFEANAGAVTLQVKAVPPSGQIRLRLVLPETPIYPGQRVRLRIEWWIATQLREHLHRYRIRSQLFDRTDAFRFLAPESEPGATELSLETAAGQVTLPAEVRSQSIAGEEFLVVAAERTMVPLKTGTFDFEPASVVVDIVTRWRRDLFGGRVPERIRKRRAEDLPRRLVVREIPRSGRPPGFAGAVGQGFTLEVSADRSVVRVGDPIQLTLVLRGDGNLESAGLPALVEDVGLSPQQFRLPAGDLDGVVEGGAKTFTVPIRAITESVREIPPLHYAYFDPVAQAFRSTQSRPIALSVRPASLVTAGDVVMGESPDLVAASAPNGMARVVQEEPSAGGFIPVGANLSIVREPEELLGQARVAVGSVGLGAIYAVSLALLGSSFVLRRRADVDPELLRQRRALRQQRNLIVSARSQPRSQALKTIAEALREMVRVSSGARPGELDEFVAECDAVTFAPTQAGEGEALDPAFQQRALELADALLEGSA